MSPVIETPSNSLLNEVSVKQINAVIYKKIYSIDINYVVEQKPYILIYFVFN